MRVLARLYITVSLVGAVQAVRRRRPARFAGLQFPGTPLSHALTVGTPLSAPPVMLMALAVAGRGRHRKATRWLSAMFLVGIVAEPDTFEALRNPNADPVTTGCAVLEVALPIAMLISSR